MQPIVKMPLLDVFNHAVIATVIKLKMLGKINNLCHIWNKKNMLNMSVLFLVYANSRCWLLLVISE